MPGVLIWGKARDVLVGDLPPGVSADEIDDLAGLRGAVDGGIALVLCEVARLEPERAAVEAWLRDGGGHQVVLVGVATPGEADDALKRLPFLDDALAVPITPGRLRATLEKAFESIHSRRVIRQLEAAVSRKGEELHELNKIGVALSAERDITKLLETILLKSREITAADAGSLYLVERGPDYEATHDDQLRFKLAQNDSVVVPFEEFTVPLSEQSIAGHAAMTGLVVNVADAYRLPEGSPYRISRSFDEKSGYRTKSMLVVPMRDHENKVIGVVQLINKKRDARAVLRPVSLVAEQVIPFTSVDEELVTSLASQAAVAYENTQLLQGIRDLFDGFVHASVTAIEQRDPVTSGHSGRVATLTVGLAEQVDAATGGPFREVAYSRDQLQEIRYASLLHDFGKVGVREEVLTKSKKLYPSELLAIHERFAFIDRTLEVEHLRAKLQALQGGGPAEVLQRLDAQHEAERRELAEILATVERCNDPTVLEEGDFRSLAELCRRTYRDLRGEPRPYLTPGEVAALSIRRGSLSPDERTKIESHVSHTYDFLSKIPWTGEFRRVPEIAYAHHEKLNGTGYPRRLQAAQIPLQSRMMTIADIYDALVAWDRPYKRSVGRDRALDILNDEARQGKLDADLLKVFIDAKVFERTPSRAGTEADAAG